MYDFKKLKMPLKHLKLNKDTKLTQSVFVFLRLAWSKTSKLAVSYTSKLKSLLLRSKLLLMKSLPLAKRFMGSGISFLRSLVASLSLNLSNLLPRLRSQLMSLLTKLKSKLTSLKTSLSSSNFKNNWQHTYEKKKKSLEQSTTQIKTTWRRHSKE